MGAVDNIAPMNEFRERRNVVAEFFIRDGSDKFGAGLVRRVVIHMCAGMLAELFGVGGSKETRFDGGRTTKSDAENWNT